MAFSLRIYCPICLTNLHISHAKNRRQTPYTAYRNNPRIRAPPRAKMGTVAIKRAPYGCIYTLPTGNIRRPKPHKALCFSSGFMFCRRIPPQTPLLRSGLPGQQVLRRPVNRFPYKPLRLQSHSHMQTR